MRFTQYTNQTGRSCACKRWHAGIGAASILRFDFLDTQRLGLMKFTQTAAAESQLQSFVEAVVIFTGVTCAQVSIPLL